MVGVLLGVLVGDNVLSVGKFDGLYVGSLVGDTVVTRGVSEQNIIYMSTDQYTI